MVIINKIKEELESLGAQGVEVVGEVQICWAGFEDIVDDQINLDDSSMTKDIGISTTVLGPYLEYMGEDGYISELSKQELLSDGIEDILNLSPHEYGILKLKYGLTPLDLYVPQFIKDRFNFEGVYL